MSDRPPITDVTGGSHGQVVAYEHALALADDYEVAGGRMRDWASRGGQTLGNGDLLESALERRLQLLGRDVNQPRR